MGIPNPIPVIKPAVAEKNYNEIYNTKLTVDSLPDVPWNAMFVGQSYDGDESVLDDKFPVMLRDLKAIAVLDPELGEAMTATLAVIGKYLVKCKQKNIRTITPENVLEVLS